MKKIQFLIQAVLVSALTINLAFSQCGNGAVGGPGGPEQPEEPEQECGDPVIPYTGNEFKVINDLQVWGGVGEETLFWKRHTNSRAVSGSQLFGMGGYTRHAYQWELSNTSADTSGRARLNLITPEGSSFNFTKIDATNWVGISGCEYKLSQSGSDLTLLTKDSKRYFFKSYPSGTTFYYLMTEFFDSQGNKYVLTYNTSKQVTQISEPGGRFLKVTYNSLSANKVDFSQLGVITAAPAAGAWTEIPVTTSATYRYVKLLSADGSYGNIAEAEFYDNLGVKLTGTVISSDSLTEANKAFDGNDATGFVSTAFSGSYVGLDLGTGKKLSKVRFKAIAGQEAKMAPTTWGYAMVKAQVANQAPVTVSVISKVETNDGRAVNYTYANFNDASVPYVFPTLTEAVYGDGTKATYGYGQIFSGQRPMVTDWSDVRYKGRQPKYKTVYQNFRASTVLGMVDKQVNVETGGTIMTVGIFSGNLHQPTAVFANGSITRHVMTNGIMTSKYDGNGNKTDYVYDVNGFLAKETDPLGRVTIYTRSPVGNILTMTHPDGGVETWTRNSLDSVTTYKDTLGRITTYSRDSQNRVTRIDYADTSYETFAYNAFSEVLQKRQRNGGLQKFTYDARGLLTQSTDALGNVTKFGYDAADRLSSVTDARNNVTTSAYNERGLVEKVTHPDGSFKSYTFNAVGDVLTQANELGNVTTYTYDIFQRVTSIKDSLNRITTTTYLADSYKKKPLTVTLPSGKKTAFTYDLEWNVLTSTAGVGTADVATTTFTYDKVYNLLTSKDPRGKIATATYDSRDRKLTQKDPLANVTTWTYDTQGNNLTVKDALNRVSTNTFDTMDRLKTTTDAKSQATSYFYDLAGNMIKMVDAKNNAYQNAFDLLNRKTAMIYPDNSKEQYGYDGVSNMISYTTRAGQIKTCAFDNRNRETSCNWSDSTPDVTRTFDVFGRLLTSSNGVSAITYTYNVANELLTEKTVVGSNTRTLSYAYTVDGNRASVAYPGGNVITYDYTNRNQISAIYEDGGAAMATYSYDLSGNRIGKTLENGTAATYAFDDASRLASIMDKKGSTSLLSTVYTLNAVGNRTAKVQDSKTETYSFDAIDQVAGVNYNSTRNVAYNYDATGNRTSVVDGTVTSNYSANNLNQYTAVAGSTLGYDLNGNLLNGGTIQSGLFFYDAQNRLTKATVGANTTEFAYDSKNRVVKRTLNGTVTYLIYDGWSLIEERNSSGTVQARYTHGVMTDEILAKTDSTGSVYYHHDGLGSTTFLCNASGVVVEKYSYDIFGKATISNATGTILASTAQGNRFMFTGREFLKEVGLHDYRNRVYSQELGRFLQTDPILFMAGDVNIYRYCGNLPTYWRDPFGYIGWGDFGALGMGLVGGALMVGGAPVIGLGLIAGAGIWELYNIYDEWNEVEPLRDMLKDMYKDSDGDGFPDKDDPDPDDPYSP